jgi:short subunit dehydrogenase-like uncharacterized protein
MSQPSILVFGAAGHTARFVVEELQRRGRRALPCGRDAKALEAAYPGAEVRVASISDAGSLDRALEGCSAVINCAGPFLDTAGPLIEAALRARVHYLDLTAEQASAAETFERFARPAEAAGVVVLPAMAFYGGLADLLATAAMGDWAEADAVTVAVALDSWEPTLGTRKTGQRNTFRRQVVSEGRLTFLADPPPRQTWHFAAPFGAQEVVGLPFSETITLARHLRVREVHSFMNLAPLSQLRDPSTPAPTAADGSGRSAQTFLMEVVARRGASERRASARGRDIYAVTAPLVVEALERILDGRSARRGTLAPGELFDARDMLAALAPEPLAVEYAA